MSLATSGGIGGAGGATGGIVLGHQANQVGQAPGAPPGPSEHADTGHGPPPPSAAVLGADLMDRQQMLSLKNVRNTSHLPIVAVDLCTRDPHVAYFPPKPEDPSVPVSPHLIGKMKATVCFKKDEDGAAQKTLRKYLAHKASYFSLQADCISKTDQNAVVLERPQEWLGLRRLNDAPEFVRKSNKAVDKPLGSGEVGVAIVNSTLDGGKESKNDDYDRVVYHVRLASSKKHLAILPEEACQLLFHQAQMHVAAKFNRDDLHDETQVLSYPLAVALPGYVYHDASVEAVLEATTNSGVVFQRSVCALAGALIYNEDKPSALLERLQKVRTALGKEYQRRKVEDPSAVFEDEVLLLMLGMTDEHGFECTAIQVFNVQQDLPTCLFGDYRVLANVSYQSSDPVSVMSKALKDLQVAIETVAPEADGPAGIVTYGTPSEQDKVRKQWDTKLKSEIKLWSKVPVFPSKSDCVAMGTALLGACCHGRQLILDDSKSDKKPKAIMGLRVQNVAPAAVGVRINYHGDDDDKWTDVKTIFDFDRRLPAGPYSMEFLASECVVYREKGPKALEEDEEAFLKAAKENEGAKHIPEREKAALDLKVQLLQKWTRDGEWKPVGDPIEPIVKREYGDNEEDFDEDGGTRIACESATLEVSLGIHGMITTSLSGDRYVTNQAWTPMRVVCAAPYY